MLRGAYGFGAWSGRDRVLSRCLFVVSLLGSDQGMMWMGMSTARRCTRWPAFVWLVVASYTKASVAGRSLRRTVHAAIVIKTTGIG